METKESSNLETVVNSKKQEIKSIKKRLYSCLDELDNAYDLYPNKIQDYKFRLLSTVIETKEKGLLAEPYSEQTPKEIIQNIYKIGIEKIIIRE